MEKEINKIQSDRDEILRKYRNLQKLHTQLHSSNKELEERIEGYKKAMVKLDKQAYERYKSQLEDLQQKLQNDKKDN